MELENKRTNKKMISILMGIYNCANTLDEAVQSIINQTYENWELIICDDCSTDRTYEVAKKLAKRDPRIILLKNEVNLTLAPTLNKCLKCASGDYIARMDGDDYCSSQRLEKEIEFLEKNKNYSLVSCQMELFDKDGVYRVITHPSVPQKRDLLKRSQFCHAGCMIRTDVLRKLDGYSENEDCRRVEDYDLWIRLYDKGYLGYNIQEPLYSMRDDRYAQKRRTFKNRLNEAKVKYRACRVFKQPINCYVYVVIPLIKWILPSDLYKLVHKNKKMHNKER